MRKTVIIKHPSKIKARTTKLLLEQARDGACGLRSIAACIRRNLKGATITNPEKK